MIFSLQTPRFAYRSALQRRWLLVAALLLFTVASTTALAEASASLPGEKSLLGRLIAPCCYTQTLDIHDSPLAADLRVEIHARLARGEGVTEIEDELVARYGERVRGTPPGNAFSTLFLGVLFFSALSAASLLLVVRRWAARGASPEASTTPAVKSAPAAPDAWEERLNAELEEMD